MVQNIRRINCLEHGEDLTPENIKKYSRLHKRCGTSFLLIVMIVSIVVFMFIRVDSLVWKFVLRILLVPVVAGISYEFIRLAGRSDSKIVNTLSKPGLYLQYFTTREIYENDCKMQGLKILNMKAGHFLTGNFISTELNFI